MLLHSHLFRTSFRSPSTGVLSCPTPVPPLIASLGAVNASSARLTLITSRFESSSASSLESSSSSAKPSSNSTHHLSTPAPPPPGRRFLPKFSILVDQLRVSLALPLSEIATLSISAALRFRHIHKDYYNATNWPCPPLISQLDLTRTSHSAMLLEKQEKSATLSEGVPQQQQQHEQEDFIAGEATALPPAYSQAMGSSNYATASSNEKARFGHPMTGDRDEDYVANPPTNEKGIPTPSNLIHVFKRDGGIRGSWNVHPGLAIPAALMPVTPTRADSNYAKGKIPWKDYPEDNVPLDATGPQPNLLLHTRDGSIHADVWISDSAEQDQGKEKKSTLLDLNTRDGKISLRVRTHGTRPLNIRAFTNDGPVTIFLPRSFVGLLLHRTGDGKIAFSPAMEASATTFSSVQRKSGSSFIGDWRGLTDGNMDSWQGDRCEVGTGDGSIYFFWEDEFDSVMEKRKSNFLKALYWTN